MDFPEGPNTKAPRGVNVPWEPFFSSFLEPSFLYKKPNLYKELLYPLEGKGLLPIWKNLRQNRRKEAMPSELKIIKRLLMSINPFY